MPQPFVIKIGGKAAEDRHNREALCDEMAAVSREHLVILLHGGGAEVTAVSRRFGIEAVFKDGIRQTSPEEMDVVDMVLRGRINSRLVRLLRTRGLNAVGLGGSDGGTFTGDSAGGPGAATRTGTITRVDPALVITLLEAGYLPVLCSTSMDGAGAGLNINADTAAFQVAAAVKAAVLVFLSDIPGVISDGSVLQAMSEPESRDLVSRGVIAGGMVPKVTASFEAMRQGVDKVIIGGYESPGALARLLNGKEGTRLWK